MKYKIGAVALKLIDSYLVSKKNFTKELNKIRGLHPSCPVWQRSNRSLRLEWSSHNLAYSLGIARDRTKDVDLNYEQKWYHKLAYGFVGTIALWLIK